MRLLHYSEKPFAGDLRVIDQSGDTHKPRGLWVSDDDCEDNWREWCISEGFGLERLACVHEVKLAPNANVLVLRSASAIDAFHAKYWDSATRRDYGFPWSKVRKDYAGLVITPYIWQRRLDGNTLWYYGWDCASGCIWEPGAIASIELLETVTTG